MHRLRALIAAIAMAALALPASATPISYNFAGVVDSDDADRGWLSFGGSFSFDSAALDGIADASTAAYAHAGAPYGISVSFDGLPAITLDGLFNLLVSNDLGGSDQLAALAQQAGSTLSLTLFDYTQTVFASDALPLQSGGLQWADFGWSSFSYEIDNESTLQGHLTGLSCNSGCSAAPPSDADPGPRPVPEPASSALVALALAGLALTRRRPT